MKRKITLLPIIACFVLWSCDTEEGQAPSENPMNYAEVGSIDLGDVGASEITAYDAKSKKLFVVNNSVTSTIDVIDLANPSFPVKLTAIDISSIGGGVN